MEPFRFLPVLRFCLPVPQSHFLEKNVACIEYRACISRTCALLPQKVIQDLRLHFTAIWEGLRSFAQEAGLCDTRLAEVSRDLLADFIARVKDWDAHVGLAIEVDAGDVVLLCILRFLHPFLRRLLALQFASLEELECQVVCIAARALISPILSHESIERVAARAEGFLEFPNLHLAGIEEGSNLSADDVAGVGDILEPLIIAVDFDFFRFGFWSLALGWLLMVSTGT